MKKTIIILSILVLSGCSSSSMKSNLITGLYGLSNPNLPSNRNTITIKENLKECQELLKQCKSYNGRFNNHGSDNPKHEDYYCSCIY